MAVREAYVPPRKPVEDPKKIGKKEEGESEYWEKAVKQQRSKREFLEESEMINRINNPSTPEPPVQIKGSINLGDFDIQAQQREAAATLAAEKKDSDEKLKVLERERDEARQQLNDAKVAELRNELNQKMSSLAEAISKGINQKSFSDQLREIQETAGLLGLAKPQATGPENGTFQIELLKMQQQMAREEREFKWKMKQDDKNWHLELKKLEQHEREAEGKLQAERERNQMLAGIPKTMGAAIGAALIDASKEAPSVGANSEQVNKSGGSYHIECRPGESGAITCPNPDCGVAVGVGPTANRAVCAGCGTKIGIKRIGEPVES